MLQALDLHEGAFQPQHLNIRQDQAVDTSVILVKVWAHRIAALRQRPGPKDHLDPFGILVRDKHFLNRLLSEPASRDIKIVFASGNIGEFELPNVLRGSLENGGARRKAHRSIREPFIERTSDSPVMCPTRPLKGVIALERREAEHKDERDYITLALIPIIGMTKSWTYERSRNPLRKRII